MSTKFILHGGAASHENPENDSFFKEILKDAPERPHILLVYFAKESPERAIASFTEDMAQFEKNSGKRLVFELADESNFFLQAKKADIIYLHGGVSSKLLAALKKVPDIKALFEGKIVAGESAGANVLSAFFYSPSADNVSEGLSLVPVKTIPHYKDEFAHKLDDYGDGLEKLYLPEYQFKVYYK